MRRQVVSMKTGQSRASERLFYVTTLWKHLLSLFIFVTVSTALRKHQVHSAPGAAFPPMPHLSSSSSHSQSSASNPSLHQPDALTRLSRVFGISRIPRKKFHRSPPQYMQDLYASITDTGGLTRASGPYNSNVIRSFPDRGKVLFFFCCTFDSGYKLSMSACGASAELHYC